MTTVERILDLIQSNNITAAKLTQEANLANGLITQWKKGLQKPSTDALVKIADYFGVSLDYLLGRTEEKNTDEKDDITFDDFTFAMYDEAQHLTEEDKQALLQMARLLKSKTEKKE